MALADLRLGMLVALTVNGLAIVLVWWATRHLARDEATLRERARAAGESL